MLKLKRAVCAAMAALLLLTVPVLSSCSTPRVAMTVDDVEYETGLYLAYLYNAFYQVYIVQGMYQYESMGMDVWEQSFPYGEGDSAETLKFADYLKKSAQDAIVRQTVLAQRIKETGAPERADDVAEVKKQLEGLRNEDLLAMGFSKEHYEEMLMAVNTNDARLFYYLYGKGGPKEMSEADIEKYFDDYYLSYKIIEIGLTDSSGADLSEDEANKVKDRLNDYLDEYKQSQDFDKVIEKYEEDEKAQSSTTTTTTTTAGGDTTTTTEAASEATTTTAETTTTTEAATTTTTTAAAGSTDDEEEENEDPYRNDIDANMYGDEDFTNAIKSIEIGTAQVVTYKKGGTTNTAALILRLDPRVKEGVENVLDEYRETIIYGSKFEEYNEEIIELMNKAVVKVDKGAERACDPKKFLG